MCQDSFLFWVSAVKLEHPQDQMVGGSFSKDHFSLVVHLQPTVVGYLAGYL